MVLYTLNRNASVLYDWPKLLWKGHMFDSTFLNLLGAGPVFVAAFGAWSGWF